MALDPNRDRWYNDPNYPRDPIEPAKGPIVGIGQFFDWLGTAIRAGQKKWGDDIWPAIAETDWDVRTIVDTVRPYIPPGNLFPAPGAAENWLDQAGIRSVDDLRQKLREGAAAVKDADTKSKNYGGIVVLAGLYVAYSIVKGF